MKLANIDTIDFTGIRIARRPHDLYRIQRRRTDGPRHRHPKTTCQLLYRLGSLSRPDSYDRDAERDAGEELFDD